GLPCVIAKGGGSGSLVQDGHNGLSCPPREAQAYLRAIQQILTQAELKERLIANALGYTKALDWSQLAQRYFEQLSILVQQNSDFYSLAVA
ncbi:MAG: glycosyltransferase, partial [Bacteroidota bacterium]